MFDIAHYSNLSFRIWHMLEWEFLLYHPDRSWSIADLLANNQLL
jgi:hypothetical protein